MASEKDQELIDVVALLALGFEIEGVQLLDAETNEPVNLRELVGLPKTPVFEYPQTEREFAPSLSDVPTSAEDALWMRKLVARACGKSETIDNDDGTFTHTFKFQ